MSYAAFGLLAVSFGSSTLLNDAGLVRRMFFLRQVPILAVGGVRWLDA